MNAPRSRRSREPSRALLTTCAIFGIHSRPRFRDRNDDARRLTLARANLRSARAGISLITGPSGSGKSRLLRTITTTARAQHHHVINSAAASTAEPPPSTLDAVARVRPPGGLRTALSCLAAAGLADALVLPRPPHLLSDGQRARLAIAVALARAEKSLAHTTRPRVLLILDEFCTALDRTTAMALCVTLARWHARHRRRARISIVCATSHDDVEGWLRPAAHLHLALDAPAPLKEAA